MGEKKVWVKDLQKVWVKNRGQRLCWQKDR